MSFMNIAFFGSSDFVIPIVQNILDNQGKTLCQLAKKQGLEQTLISQLPKEEISLSLIVTQPDRQNRSKVIQNPVTKFAIKNNLNIYQPLRLRKELMQAKEILQSIDLAIVASFGQIIPEEIVNLPKYGFINWHPSRLPQYRGPTPIQTAILDGATQTALTWIQMNDQMDAGDILYQERIDIREQYKFSDIAHIAGKIGAQTWAKIAALQISSKKNNFTPLEQKHSQATFTNMLNKEAAKVDPHSMTAEQIYNHFRAYSSFPTTKVLTQKWGLIRLDKVSLVDTAQNLTEEITLINNKTLLTCANHSALILDQITLPNGKQIKFSY